MANTINININKTDLGLNNVDNTSDLNKPISTATQTALNGKENVSNKSTNTSLGTSDTLYPTQNAVKTYVDTSITTAPTPTLQQVTTSGNTSNNNITVANATFNNNMTPSQHTVYRSGTNKGVILDADGEVRLNTNGNFTGNFKATNLTADVTCEIPNKTAGSYTIATTDLISNVVNIDTTTTLNITDSLNKRFVTDAQLTTIGNTSGTNTGDQTFLNARVQSVTSSATVTATSTNDLVIITAQATGLTLANPTGIFSEGQALMIRIKDNGTARTITFGAKFRALGVTSPTTTVINKTMYLGVIYNATDDKFDIVGLNQEA